MKLSSAFGLLEDIQLCLRYALGPTLFAIYATPSLLLKPSAVSSIFMAHVWRAFADGTDENGRIVKEQLITPHAKGIVLDIGAGKHALLTFV